MNKHPIRLPEDAVGPAQELARELDVDDRTAPYQAHTWTGDGGFPTLYLDDVSAIPFLVNIQGVEEYQQRARARAGDGDLFAAVTLPSAGYERYCRETLGLGRPEPIVAEALDNPLQVADACSRGAALETLVERARRAGGLLIHPYMSIDPVWELARAVAAGAQVPVQVVGPPPPLTWIANDKRVFGELVVRILGHDWWVPTTVARSAASLTSRLLEMAERFERVGLKRTRCASAMGNAVFESGKLRAEGRNAVEERVRRFLERTEWDGREEVLVVAWESTEISPSTQTWIPSLGTGPPVVEGVYEQILEGREKVFVGSRPSTLPESLNSLLTNASLALGTGLQAMGYRGRCSFDFLVVGDPANDCRCVLTECNGRWGGTSIPMHLVDRLVTGPRPPYRAQDYAHADLIGVPFEEILTRVGDHRYDARSGRGRFVFYNVGPLARWGKLDVIALGRSQEEAEEGLLCELPRLLAGC